MTAPASSSAPRPIAGENFHRVRLLRMQGAKRRRALALCAAYLDAGVADIPLTDMAERLGLKAARTWGILRRLEADGLVQLERPTSDPQFRCVLTLPEREERP